MQHKWGAQSIGFAIGLFVAIGFVTAFGARDTAAPTSPRYSVTYAGIALLIADNQTNQLFIYENAAEGSKLRSVIDLTETGQKLIKGDSAILAPAVDAPDLSQLVPKNDFEITAKLRGQVTKLTDESVFLEVRAIQETEQGVPMLSKLPHQQRLFKTVGVVRTEIASVIEIKKDHIQRVAKADKRKH